MREAILDDWGDADGLIPGWASLAPPDEVDAELLELLNDALAALGDRSRDIVRRRLGLDAGDGETLAEIAVTYGLSRERIRQLDAKAGARLRAAAKHDQGPASDLADRITSQMRHRPTHARATYLRTTLAGSNDVALTYLVGGLIGTSKDVVAAWLRAYDEQESRQQANAERGKRWGKVLAAVIWPEAPSSGGSIRQFSPCRQVGSEGGEQWSPKLGRLVQYESSTERSILKVLEKAPEVASYCEQPCRIGYRWFDGRHNYIPDFAVQLVDGRCFLLEVKPRTLWAEARNLAKWNSATRWCSAEGLGFAVADDRGGPQAALARAMEDDRLVLERLTAEGPALRPALQQMWFRDGRAWTELVGACLQYGFALERAPLRVHRARNSPWLTALHDGQLPSQDAPTHSLPGGAGT